MAPDVARTRATARKAGGSHERVIADIMAATVDDRIDRRVKTGSADKGDIAGVRLPGGGRMVIECKDYGGQIKAAEWMAEARTEAKNDGAVAAAVAIKRRGVSDPLRQYVLMEMQDLIVLLGGDPLRPKLGHPEG